jgi:hypothetical protein
MVGCLPSPTGTGGRSVSAKAIGNVHGPRALGPGFDIWGARGIMGNVTLGEPLRHRQSTDAGEREIVWRNGISTRLFSQP